MNKKNVTQLRCATKCIVAGSYADKLTNAVAPPIYQTSTFKQDSPGVNKGFDYARTHNPTRSRLEEAYASLEDADFAIALSSGMAAEAVILHSIPTGSHILASNHIYGGTYRILTTLFSQIHSTLFFNFIDLNRLENYLKTNKCDYIWIESPTNPLLHILDIQSICKLAKQYKVKVIVDNTIASPFGQQPLTLGVDLIFHSSTKYLNGHSDVIAGAIMTSDEEWYEHLHFAQNTLGTTPGPMDCWLVLRGLKTLGLRMQQHQSNALALASWLEKKSKIEKVIYPGLPSHPQHKLAKQQMNNFSGMLSFYLKADGNKTAQFLNELNLMNLAVSLGGVETLIDQPFVMTHGSVPDNVKLSLGIQLNTIRVSVGVEDVEDLINDMDQALAKI